MGRPAVVSTEEILRAARELFLAQGYGVTTAAIARRAGVSEGSIFKRFPTKERLFFAALGFPEPAWIDGLPDRAGSGDLADNLTQILLLLIEFFRELVPRLMMLWSCRALQPPPEMFRGSQDIPPVRGLKALCAYVEREQRLGRVRPCNPEVVARMIVGSAQNFVFLELMNIRVNSPLQAEGYAGAVIDLLLQGLTPGRPPVAPVRRARTA